MVRGEQAPIWKFMYLVMKNDKVNNWSQEMHAITPHRICLYQREK